MSITTGEGIALYRAGKSLFGSVREAFKNRPGGKQTQQIQAVRTAPTRTPNQQRIAAIIAVLERALGNVFSNHPMDLSRPAVLQLHLNDVSVTNRHLDGARLEALFNDRPDLQQLLHRVDIALRAEAGTNPTLRRATTLTIGPNGITATLQPF